MKRKKLKPTSLLTPRVVLFMGFMVCGQLFLSPYVHAAGCNPTLAKVFPILQVAAPEIRQAIELARSQDVLQAMEKATQQGYTPEAAIAAVMEQARAFDETAARAAKTAEMVDARGVTDEEFMRRLHNGTLEIPAEGCVAIRASALCAMAVNRIAAMALRYMAREMRCFQAAGQWPVDAQARQIDLMVEEVSKGGQLNPKPVSNPSPAPATSDWTTVIPPAPTTPGRGGCTGPSYCCGGNGRRVC